MNKFSKIKGAMLLCTSLNTRNLLFANDLKSSFHSSQCRLLKNLTAYNSFWSLRVGNSTPTNIPTNLNTVLSILTTSRKLSSSKRNHYDVLGITPKATQKEVKAAYFKLSKVYHPDVTNEEASAESSARFRDISEAYEILGNTDSRKEYDSQYMGKDYGPEGTYPEFRTRRPPRTGRSSIYNYDEWTRYHYSEIFERQARELRRRQWVAENREMEPKMPSIRQMLFALINLLFFLMLFQFVVSRYVDTPKPRNNGTKPK